MSQFIFTLVGCGECNEPHKRRLFKAIDAVRSTPQAALDRIARQPEFYRPKTVASESSLINLNWDADC